MTHSNGMNAYNFNKKIERLEKEIDKLKQQLKDKDNQIKFREKKFDELKETTNELFDEKQNLIVENKQLRQQTCQETEKNYILFTCWDKGDVDSRFVDNIFGVRCLKKVGGFDEPIYGNTLTYLYTGTPSARKEITRTLTSMLQSLYPDSNISVYAKERQDDGQTTKE